MGPTITVFVLLTTDRQVLLAQRRHGSPPFGGRWTLPVTVLRPNETAEECLERLVTAELGVEAVEYEFADTLYLDDPAGAGRCRSPYSGPTRRPRSAWSAWPRLS